MTMLDVGGQPLHVIDRGAGPAVLLLHAFPFPAQMWHYQLEALEATNRCLALDLPGFGESPPPRDPAAATVDDWADLAAGALDALGVRAASVVGASMGGYLAMAMLRRHRSRIERLVLAGTRASSDDAATAQRRTEQLAHLRAGAELDAMAKALVEGLLSSASLARDDLVEYVRSLAAMVCREGWIAALEAMRKRPDAMLTLRQAEVPALVIVGELDRVTPIADATLIRSMLGEARLVVIPGVGHLPNLEDPVSFDAALSSFLAQPSARPGAPEAPAG